MSADTEKTSFFGKIKSFFTNFYKSFWQILATVGTGILVYLGLKVVKNTQENSDAKKKEKLTEDVADLKDNLDDITDKIEEAKETVTVIDETVQETKDKIDEKIEEYVSKQEETLKNAGFTKDK